MVLSSWIGFPLERVLSVEKPRNRSRFRQRIFGPDLLNISGPEMGILGGLSLHFRPLSGCVSAEDTIFFPSFVFVLTHP